MIIIVQENKLWPINYPYEILRVNNWIFTGNGMKIIKAQKLAAYSENVKENNFLLSNRAILSTIILLVQED